jgi:hypothetical protein
VELCDNGLDDDCDQDVDEDCGNPGGCDCQSSLAGRGPLPALWLLVLAVCSVWRRFNGA